MTPVQAIVLGAVQGLTEFLPVSSSAHLIVVPWLLGWPDQGLTFDVVLHAGTLIAILSFFWRDWLNMLSVILAPRKVPEHERTRGKNVLILIVLATLPAAVIGFLAEKTVESTLRSPFVLSVTLIGVAILLWLAEKIARLQKEMHQLSIRDAMSIGLAQALALVPGTSRSGITIAVGLFRGLTRETAARFSFLLSGPIIAGAGLKKLIDLCRTGVSENEMLPMTLGFLSSLLFGYFTIKFLMSYLQRNTLRIFILYRIALGILILALIGGAGFRP